jgi:hypothetical protein
MSTTITKTYRVGVIERAIAYYDIEADDARSAAANWQDGEFYNRDDEALDSEGPRSVREKQPDGSWRKVPRPEWDAVVISGNPIPAEAHSDDRVISAEFNAGPWFEQASDHEIRDLAGCGWGGDYPADAVAIGLAENDPGLGRLFGYLEIIAADPSKKNCRGFECRVDETAALEWLRIHRPSIWAQLTGRIPYSVLLLYPDYANDSGTETYYAFVAAPDAIEAVAVAQRQAVAANEGAEFDDPDDYAPLLVTAGHHHDEPMYNK